MNISNPFLVFEGIDGAGTTTQSRLLCERLQKEGKSTILTREPSTGPIGTMIRQMLSLRIVLPNANGETQPVTRETLALLFAADRLDHVAATIEPALEQQKTVISDRYYHSSLAYQGDVEPNEDGAEEEVDYDWVDTINSRARVPDLTFFLKIDLETSMSRLDSRASRDFYETQEKLERLIKRYDEVIALLQSKGQRILILDGTRPIEELHQEIWSLVSTWFGSRKKSLEKSHGTDVV